MSSTVKVVAAALALSGALSAAAFPVLAASPAERTPAELVTARVSYADLNMSSPQGGKILLARISRAASKICSEAVAPISNHPRAQSDCRRAAITGAVGRTNIESLTLAWGGARPPTALSQR